MIDFKTILTFEWRRFLERRKLLFTILFTLIALYFVQTGINYYKTILENNREVAAHEREKAAEMNRYETYASTGVNLRLSPPPTSIFFDNFGRFKELSARVNGLHAIDIMVHLKGKNAFQERQWFSANFSGWFVFAATLLMMFYGLDTFKSRRFSMTAASLAGQRRYFIFTVAARLLIAGCLSAFIILFGVMQALLNGIYFSANDLLYLAAFMAVWMTAGSFFFALGLLTGLYRPRLGAGTVALMIWMLLVFILPMTIDHISSYNAASIPSNVATDKQKWNAINKIEHLFQEEHGDLNSVIAAGKDSRGLIKKAYEDEYRSVREIEGHLETQMKSKLETHHAIAMLAPPAFMLSSAAEISGKGLGSLMDFFRFSRDFKRDFFFYFLEKKSSTLGSVPTLAAPESFVKNSENIFRSRSLLPGWFLAGVMLSLFYVALSLYFSYRRYNRMLYDVDYTGQSEEQEISLRLRKSQYSVLTVSGDRVVQFLYTVLSGRFPQTGGDESPLRLTIDGREFSCGDIDFSGRFFYVCPPEALPGDISVEALADFLGGLMHLGPEEKQNLHHRLARFTEPGVLVEDLDNETKSFLLLEVSALKTVDLCVYHDIVTGLSGNTALRLAEIMYLKTARGNMSLYLTRDSLIKKSFKRNGFYLFEDKIWREQLKFIPWKTTLENNFSESSGG